jgi:hypothetical protein
VKSEPSPRRGGFLRKGLLPKWKLFHFAPCTSFVRICLTQSGLEEYTIGVSWELKIFKDKFVEEGFGSCFTTDEPAIV